MRLQTRQKIRAKVYKKPVRIESITFQGNLLTYRGSIGCQTPPTKQKGSVNREFSPAARLRLLRNVATVDFERTKNSLFLTLTYPDSHFDLPYRMRTQHRHLFWRKLEKFLGREAAGIWRVEWKPRLTGRMIGQRFPHVHFLIFDVAFIPWRSVATWWADVIHTDDWVQIDIEKVVGAKGVGYYVAKYCSKLPESYDLVKDLNLNTPGRAYGYQRQGSIPRCPKNTLLRPSEGQIKALRAFAKAARPEWEHREGESFILFSDLIATYEKFILQIK